MVFRQSYKGICPAVTVHVGLCDVYAIQLTPLVIALGHSPRTNIFHGCGEGDTFRGNLRIFPPRHGNTPQFHSGAILRFEIGIMTHRRKAAQSIAPCKKRVTPQSSGTYIIDEYVADCCQHAPCGLTGAGRIILELYKLVVGCHRCINFRSRPQGIRCLNGRGIPLGCFFYIFRLLQEHIHALNTPHAIAIGRNRTVRRLSGELPTCSLRGRRREICASGLSILMQCHTDIIVLQHK